MAVENVSLLPVKIQASGVKVDGACKQAYDDLHQKHLHSYLIFRISDDDTTIIIEKKGDKAAPYSEFVEVGGVVAGSCISRLQFLSTCL